VESPGALAPGLFCFQDGLKARNYTGLMEKSALVREALKALVQREAARRLANLGGSQPGVEGAPRRRAESE
jgi:Arc/MetJ family transcription regulator